MDLRAFAKRVVEGTQEYLRSGDERNPDVINNIKQYLEEDRVWGLARSYQLFVEIAREDTNRKLILDVASGINWAKYIDPNIVTSNPHSVNVYGYRYFNFINNYLNVPTDLVIGDLRRDENWLDTGSLRFDCVICCRFLPFINKSYGDDDYRRFFEGVRGCLAPKGVVWLSTEDEITFLRRVETRNHKDVWSKYKLREHTYIIESTKEKLDAAE